MRSASLVSLVTGVAVTAGAAPAVAQEFPTTNPEFEAPSYVLPAAVNPFGGAGQLVFSSDFRVSFEHDIFSPPQGESSSQDVFVVAPMVDYFVANNVSVGVVAGLEYTKMERGSLLTVLAGPELGYNIPVGSRGSLFPRVGVAYFRKSSDDGADTVVHLGATLLARVPLLLHVGKNFFLGAGPYFSTQLSSKSRDRDAGKLTIIGLGLEIGGWR